MHLKSQKLWSSQTLAHTPVRNSLIDINGIIHSWSATSGAPVLNELEHNQTDKGICTKHLPISPSLLPVKTKWSLFFLGLIIVKLPFLLFFHTCWCFVGVHAFHLGYRSFSEKGLQLFWELLSLFTNHFSLDFLQCHSATNVNKFYFWSWNLC